MSEDISSIVARLRRAQPRNLDTQAVCDALAAALDAQHRKVECPECARRKAAAVKRTTAWRKNRKKA
jgi:hypothetical protein